MALGEKIPVIFDAKSEGFGKVRADIAAADGAMGKAKAGAKGLGDMLRQNAAPAAIAAGGALVAFGIKAVGAFQDAALSAGKFADATGLAVEDASRWIEVAGDLGIEAGTIEGSFTKLNLAIANGKPALKDYGVEIVRTKDGVVDANATFLNARSAIAAIEDPTKKAQAAQQLFGRSYTEVAELLEMSAGDVQAALEGVSDAKVISPEELKRARDYRAAMDALNDKLQDLSITVGGRLADEFVYAAETADMLATAVGKIPGGGKLWDVLAPPTDMRENVRNNLAGMVGLREEYEFSVASAEMLKGANERLSGELGDTGSSADDLGADLADLDKKTTAAKNAMDAAERATRDLNSAYDSLMGNLDQEEKWEAFSEAVWNLADGSGDAAAEMRDWKRAAAELVTGLEGMPEEQKTALLLEINEGDKATVDAILFKWQEGVQVPVRFVGQGNVGFMKNAKGTPPGGSPGGLTLVGEEGPELVEMPKGAHVTPAPETARLLSGGGSGAAVSGGNTYVTNNNITTAADPNSVIAAIKQYERLNGKGWRS